MTSHRDIASWLVVARPNIEAAMNAQLGPAAPSPASPESEALRRFRTFASTALMRDEAAPPNLDGLRVNQRRALALLEAWLETSTRVAAERGAAVQAALRPLVDAFARELRANHNASQTQESKKELPRRENNLLRAIASLSRAGVAAPRVIRLA